MTIYCTDMAVRNKQIVEIEERADRLEIDMGAAVERIDEALESVEIRLHALEMAARKVDELEAEVARLRRFCVILGHRLDALDSRNRQ